MMLGLLLALMAAGIRQAFTAHGMPGAGAQALKKRKKKREEKQASAVDCLIGCF